MRAKANVATLGILGVAIMTISAILIACGGLDASLTELEVGDCVRKSDLGVEEVKSLDHVDCDEGGTVRVVHAFDITGFDDFPGDEMMASISSTNCPADASFSLEPTRQSWNEAGDREVVCFQ